MGVILEEAGREDRWWFPRGGGGGVGNTNSYAMIMFCVCVGGAVYL